MLTPVMQWLMQWMMSWAGFIIAFIAPTVKLTKPASNISITTTNIVEMEAEVSGVVIGDQVTMEFWAEVPATGYRQLIGTVNRSRPELYLPYKCDFNPCGLSRNGTYYLIAKAIDTRGRPRIGGAGESDPVPITVDVSCWDGSKTFNPPFVAHDLHIQFAEAVTVIEVKINGKTIDLEDLNLKGQGTNNIEMDFDSPVSTSDVVFLHLESDRDPVLEDIQWTIRR